MLKWRISRTVDIAADAMQTERLKALATVSSRFAHEIRICVLENQLNADLTGFKAAISLIFPDQTSLSDVKADVVQGNCVTVTLPNSCYGQAGEVRGVLHLSDDQGGMLPLYAFVLYVGADMTDVLRDPDNVVPSVAELLAQIQAMRDATREAKTATQNANTAAGAANTAAGKANTAASNADTAAGKANAAAGKADTAAGKANTAAGKIDKMTTAATALPEGVEPTAQMTDDGNKIHIAFGIPRGSTGQTGPQGETGATPRITFTVETGEPGTQVVVTQSGTAENPVVNLKIPRGVDGKGSVSAVKLGETTHDPDDAGVVDLGDIETPLSDSNPVPLGKTAAPGTSMQAARGDHVHPLPTAANVGARPASWMPTAADVGAYPAGAVRTAQISIAASAWSGSGPYNTVLRIPGLTAQTDCRFDLGTTLTMLAADVAWETGAGTITLTTTKKPTGELSGRVVLMEVAT